MLSRGAVEEYLSRRHPGLGEPETVAELVHRRTAGNPLFIECLLRSWSERGAMVQDDGRWRLRAEPQELVWQVPDTLRELIEQDIDGLHPDEQRILETASVVGTEFSAAAVASGAGLGTEDAEALCAGLARHGLLRERPPADWPDGTVAAAFAFTHDLHRQVLYERLPAARRARLHGEVAARLEAAYRSAPAERAAELAGHFIRGRQPAPAVRYLRLSAQQAIARGAPAEAVRDVRTALELLERSRDIPREDGTELWLHAALAGALVGVAGYASADAERAIRRALEIARARNDSPSAARLLHGLGGMHEYRGEHQASEALAGEALRVGGGAPELAVEAHDLMACSLFHQGRFSAALEQAELALSLHRPQHGYVALAPHGEHPLVSCHEWAGLALWCMGQPEQALARIRAAVSMAADPGRLHSLAYARVHAARLHQMRGEPSEAKSHAELGLALAHEHGFAYHAATAQVLVGWAQALSGQEGGVDLLRAGLEAHRATGAQLDRPYFLALLAEAWWAAGRPDQGLQAVTEASQNLGGADTFFWESELHRLRGALTLEVYGSDGAGDAEGSFRQALEAARRQGAGSLELRAAASLARVLRDRGAELEAGTVLEVACAPFGAEPAMPDLHEARTLLSQLRESSL